MNKFKFKIHQIHYTSISCHLKEKKKVDKSKHLINDGNMLAIHSMQLQNLIQNSPAIKSVQPPRRSLYVSEIQGGRRPRNGLMVS